jgi:hypothetical protein
MCRKQQYNDILTSVFYVTTKINYGLTLLESYLFHKHPKLTCRQSFLASRWKKSWKKIDPSGIRTGALIWQSLADTELNH